MAPDGLAPHPPANRGGAVGGAAAATPEPPGLRRPKTSHPPAGRPEPRAAPPALPFTGAGGERPALRDGSTKSSTGWCWSNLLRGSLRRPRSGSSATARRRWTWPSNSLWTRWWRARGLAKPYCPSLSLSPPLLCLPLSSYPGPVPAWFPEPSPDGEEDRHRSRRP